MKPVEKVSITDQVVASIRELIESGEVGIGAKMPTEQQLGAQLNVGRSTVREALRVLQAFGYIEIRPGRGAFVVRKSVEPNDDLSKWFFDHRVQLQDYMELRRAIETLAVELATQRATKNEIAEMGEVLSEFDHAAEDQNVARLASLDEAFHRLIMTATHNNLIININRLMERALFDYRTRAFAVKENIKNAVGPHRRILEAIRNGDVGEGVKQMSQHIEISLRDISSVIEDLE